jgi:PAS domain-containing protein
MLAPWGWTAICALTLLVVYQQFRIYWERRSSRNRDELFQIVTENAADMIALVDMKGRRLYNSPAYKKILG